MAKGVEMTPTLTPREAVEEIRQLGHPPNKSEEWLGGWYAMQEYAKAILSRVTEEPQRGHVQNCECRSGGVGVPVLEAVPEGSPKKVIDGMQFLPAFRDPRCAEPPQPCHVGNVGWCETHQQSHGEPSQEVAELLKKAGSASRHGSGESPFIAMARAVLKRFGGGP